jgi:Ca2+-binding RTX toxin-like protein
VSNTVVRYIDFAHTSASAPSFLIESTAPGQRELVGVNLGVVGSSSTVVFKGIENVVVGGAGTVRFQGDTGVRMTNDSAQQTVVGGDGNDVLITLGGNDTLAGGGGQDTFTFAGVGHFTVTDFNPKADRLAFNFNGINKVADLAPFFTGVEESSTGVTFHFGPAASITLAGVHLTDVAIGSIGFHV